MVWHAATFAAFGLSFVGVRYALKNINVDAGEEDGLPQTDSIEPAAEVTSKVYMDISIDKQPAGRIVLGLYGGVVPKTAMNFQKLCEGTEKRGNIPLSFQNSIFHRIIPGFMVRDYSIFVLLFCFLTHVYALICIFNFYVFTFSDSRRRFYQF